MTIKLYLQKKVRLQEWKKKGSRRTVMDGWSIANWSKWWLRCCSRFRDDKRRSVSGNSQWLPGFRSVVLRFRVTRNSRFRNSYNYIAKTAPNMALRRNCRLWFHIGQLTCSLLLKAVFFGFVSSSSSLIRTKCAPPAPSQVFCFLCHLQKKGTRELTALERD